MTRAEWADFASKLDVGWPFRAWGARFRVTASTAVPGVMVLALTVPGAPHRDTGEVDESSGAHYSSVVDVTAPADLVLHMAQSMLKQFATHEADEALLFDGARPFDPHPQQVPLERCPDCVRRQALLDEAEMALTQCACPPGHQANGWLNFDGCPIHNEANRLRGSLLAGSA
jgi:hypothetical protein